MLGYLISAIVGLLGFGVFQTIRNQGFSALLSNFKLKNKLNDLDNSISKNSGLDQAEKQKRDAIQDALDGKIKDSQDDTLTDLKDFFDKPDKP